MPPWSLATYLVVTVMLFFLHIFYFHQAFFMALRSNFFEIIGKSREERVWWGSTFCYAGSLRTETLRIFWNFQNNETVEEMWRLWVFFFFSLNFSIAHFSLLKPFGAHLHFLKNFFLFHFLYHMSILFKINLCGNNFPKCRQFWLIWQNSIPKKYTF